MKRATGTDRPWTRRSFLATALAGGAAGHLTGLIGGLPAAEEGGGAPPGRKMTIDLALGAIGHGGGMREALDLAARHGFESIAASSEEIERLRPEDLEKLLADMKAKRISFGAAGLPVEIGGDEKRFEEGLAKLDGRAAAIGRAGIGRMGTYVSPGSRSRTYIANFRLHAARLRRVAEVLEPRGIRLGLEYVAPKTSWSRSRFPFIHTLAEMKDLIAEAGKPNLGLVLDSWHWHCARETEGDILSLRGRDVVSVHLNDAPAGKPIDELVDGSRDLPCATGVIDLAKFLGALNRIGYDGPAYAEPFLPELSKLSRDEAVATTAAAMKKAFALLR
jgi:sugar phosphate isomerase/epimerase